MGGLHGSSNPRGPDGAGGVGVYGSDLAIINSGSITGGLGGDGVRANAITFAGGVNSLELDLGSSITGNVAAFSTADTLKLGGDGNGSFDVSTIGPQYQGFGNFQKTGTGTWALTGTTTAVTPWTITGGTLSISQDASLGDAAGTLTLDGGTLQVTGTFSSMARPIVLGNNGGGIDITTARSLFMVGQTLSGAGSLTISGPGLVYLSANNTYTGGTIIQSGSTLILGGSGNGAGIVGDVVDNGTLIFLSGNDITFAGSISGSGGLQVQNANTVLTGENTFTGPIVLQGANLQIGNGRTTGSIVADVGVGQFDTGTVVFDRSDAITYGGTISGAITVGQIGSGTLVLNGINTYTGATEVRAGSLIVGGDMAHASARIAGNVAVDRGTTLGGHGTIGGNVNVLSGAHLAPGYSLGTLTVNGNLSLAQGSQLDFEVGAPGADFSTAGLSDSVSVGGDLTLNGTTLNVTDSGAMGPGIYNLFSYTGALTQSNGGMALGTLPAGSNLFIQVLEGDHRIDLVNTSGMTLNYWNANGQASSTQRGGGTGTWSATSRNWTDDVGTVNGAIQPQPGLAIFGGDAGVVTVDTGGGASPVRASGLQFISDGYTLTGDTLTLVADSSHPAPVVVNVGDGSAASANWTATIGNVIDGSDGLSKSGAGTLVLTGVNSYTGGTTISAGTLSISQEENLGDASGALTLDGGTLRITGNSLSSLSRNLVLGNNGGGLDIADASAQFSVSQSLAGSGGLFKSGDGALVLTGDNTYTGGTSVLAGSLQIGDGGSTGSIVGDVQTSSGAALAFDRADTLTFGGAVSGAGELRQIGGGTLILTGANTYTGGTSVLAGGLQIGDGGTTGSIAGDVQTSSGTTLAFNRSDAYTFGGVISGDGALRQMGTGTLVLTGDSSAFTGTGEVNAGTLVVDGKLGGTLSVASGATLAGVGTVGATTIASGATLAPGNSASPIGTLTVNGNLTFASGSVYQVHTDPATATNDKVHATGTATLAGSVVQVDSGGNYTASTSYTILTADQGVHGTFDTLSSNLAFLTPTLAYDGNNVDLKVDLKQVPTGGDDGAPQGTDSGGGSSGTRPIRFADAALTGNQRAVANALQSLPTSNDLYSRVLNLPNGAPPAVFKALSGETHASTTTTLQGVANNVLTLPLSHFRANLDAGQLPGPATAQLGMGDASALPRSAAQPAWAQVFGNWRTLGSDGNASKVSETDGGVFVGADHAVGGGWRLGGALGYTNSHSSTDDVNSTGDVDSYSATIYGGKAFAAGPGKINLTAGAAYTWHDIRTQRQVNVMDLNQTLKASYSASTSQFFGELGYAMPLNDRVTLEPFVGADYSDTRTRAFSESGGSAALHGPSNRNDVTTTTLGLHAQTVFDLQETQGRLHGTLGWRHAFGDVTPETTMAFNGSQPFTVAGVPIAHNAAVLELGADIAMTKNTTVGIAYGGQFGSGNKQNTGNINVSWRF